MRFYRPASSSNTQSYKPVAVLASVLRAVDVAIPCQTGCGRTVPGPLVLGSVIGSVIKRSSQGMVLPGYYLADSNINDCPECACAPQKVDEIVVEASDPFVEEVASPQIPSAEPRDAWQFYETAATHDESCTNNISETAPVNVSADASESTGVVATEITPEPVIKSLDVVQLDREEESSAAAKTPLSVSFDAWWRLQDAEESCGRAANSYDNSASADPEDSYSVESSVEAQVPNNSVSVKAQEVCSDSASAEAPVSNSISTSASASIPEEPTVELARLPETVETSKTSPKTSRTTVTASNITGQGKASIVPEGAGFGVEFEYTQKTQVSTTSFSR